MSRVCTALLLLAVSASTSGHIGPLDPAGCHESPRTGIYHCHVTPPAGVAERPAGMPVGFDNCEDVKAADAAPLRRGQPGYGVHLDPDRDGVACDR